MKVQLVRDNMEHMYPLITGGIYIINGYVLKVVERDVEMLIDIYIMQPNLYWKLNSTCTTFAETTNTVLDIVREESTKPVGFISLVGKYLRNTYLIEMTRGPTLMELWKNMSECGAYIFKCGNNILRLTIAKRKFDISVIKQGTTNKWDYISSHRTIIGAHRKLSELLT